MVSPKHFLLSLSGLGITSSGLLAWILATGNKYAKLNFIFKTRDEANQELVKEGEKECGAGAVWITTDKTIRVTSDLYKRKNNKNKDWSEYQSCLKSVGEQEKYKQWSTKSSK